MLLNLSVSGVPFCGSDVGGFLDNATPELLVRWVQMGAFTPFFRNHSNIGTIDQEPWALGQQAEASCRRFIELRYQLLPYLYSLFLEASRSGSPIMRFICRAESGSITGQASESPAGNISSRRRRSK